MTVDELIDRARVRLDDAAEPYLASDASLILYADTAQRQACERALLLYDSSASFCSISVTAGRAKYPLDPRIMAIVAARLDGEVRSLEKFNLPDMYLSDYVANAGSGTPRFYVEDGSTITLVPTPDAAFTLKLTVYRYPLYPVESLQDEFEVDEAFHYPLVHWVCYEALSVQDAELFDPQAAERELALFERSFGRARTARELKTWKELSRGTAVRMRSL